ncbi:response regulator [Devosia oryziradicis]|uniref:histidine kinase n=1 Tax=Devosia oryziradicis TaxID=2801335 RepID=A0ABX7BY62_9HYPH|nr:ATP-binding protein [Devosia oryziradicis]QQR36741.1 response regulator [Devosia oryziradicis]
MVETRDRRQRGIRGRLRRALTIITSLTVMAAVLAWIGLTIAESRLERHQAQSLSDLGQITSLVGRSVSLAADSARISYFETLPELEAARAALAVQMTEFKALAEALPSPASTDIFDLSEVPSIVRLVRRLDATTQSLFSITAEAIALRESPDPGDKGLAQLKQSAIEQRTAATAAMVETSFAQLTKLIEGLSVLVQKAALDRGNELLGLIGMFKTALIAGALASLVAGLLISAFLTRAIVRSLVGATHAISRLAEGDSSAELPGDDRDDEIGDLARAYKVFKANALERDHLERRLRHVQQMEALGQLTGGIAHDFNNLLAAVSSNLQLIQDQSSAGSPTHRRVDRALGAVESGSAMIQRLLLFARRQALQPEVVDLNQLVTGLVDLIELSIDPAITLKTELARELPAVTVDPGQMESAVLNLVFNARDAIAGPGTITLATRVIGADRVELSVRDTGVGMPPEVLAQAFDPFFTTKPFGAGSGLGLSTVFGFIQQSEGNVTIDSDEGRGTIVRLELPGTIGRKKPRARRRMPGRPLPSGNAGKRVLLVEDDEILRATTADMLESLGYVAVPVASAEAALRQLRKHPFDILFSDIVLTGGEDGWSLAKKARQVQPDLALLLSTGYGNQTDGPSEIDVLTKPYSRTDLAHRLNAALVEARQAQPETASTSPANM